MPARLGRILVLMSLLAMLPAAAGGCMKSRASASGEFDSMYFVRPNVMRSIQEAPAAPDGMPRRMIIIREESTWAGVRNLVLTQQRLRQGEPEGLRLLITPEMAAEVAEELRELAGAIANWSEAVDAYTTPAGRAKWAEDAAKVFAVIYRVDYGAEAADPRPYANREMTYLSRGAPMARSIMEYVGRQTTSGDLFADGRLLKDDERRRLVIQFGLAGVFQAADLRIPDHATDEILEIMEQGPMSAVVVQGMLQRKLLELRQRAERDERPVHRDEMTRYLGFMPGVLKNLARLLEQWDKFYLVIFETAEIDGQTVGSMVVDVRPGYEVRIDQLHSLAPALTGKGRFRLNFWQQASADDNGSGTIHIQCINERGGQAAVRFEQWFYSLAGIFAFPLDDWSLQAVEIATERPEPHLKLTTTTVLMKLTHGEPGQDSRRVLRIRESRRLMVETKGQKVDRIAQTEREIEFHTPEKVWYDSSTSRSLLPGP